MSAGTLRPVRVTLAVPTARIGVSSRLNAGLMTRQVRVTRVQFNRFDKNEEGVLWALGWRSKAASALKVAVALGADQWPAQEYR